MAGTLKVGGKVLATHNSETDEISLDSATNTSNMSFDANHAGIKTALNASGDAPIYACRAWVKFNAAGATPSITAQGNVDSITDVNTGRFIVNFSTNMPDENYAVAGMSGNAAETTAGRDVFFDNSTTSSACAIRVTYYDNTVADDAQTTVCFFR